MFDYICKNAIFKKNGIEEKILCKAFNNELCCCIRYCAEKKSIEHSEMAPYCLKNPDRIKFENGENM